MESPTTSLRAALGPAALGGGLAGCLAGALGGAFASSLETVTPPASEDALVGALVGALIGSVCGIFGGWPVAALAMRHKGQRHAILGAFATVFWSTAAAAVEAVQMSLVHALAVYLLGIVALPLLALGLRALGTLLWRGRWIVAGFLGICLIGDITDRVYHQGQPLVDPSPEELVVQLWSATLPAPLGAIAAHHWFLSFDPAEGQWHRWELWQFADQCPTSWGHVHRDLMFRFGNVGGGPARFRREWRGAEATALHQVLLRSSEYPHRDRYLAWPGPNSNTYIAWVFRESGVSHDIDCRGIGQDYLGRAGVGLTTTAKGVQVETSLLGLRIGVDEGVELHFVCFVFGVDLWRPALKTPLGRFGFAD